ncbi:MAG: YggS family pyridoxal phosphate-dependent enzyme [Spirochaetes bacterium]|nr:YggS family pyridoxal phosphate-dependent enzyme [Spirochaetota bacterium]
MGHIIDNFNKIIENVRQISVSEGRDQDKIKIIAVSKTFPYTDVQEAIESGIYIFGENKVQEAKKKAAQLKGEFSLHLIGHLQSNKAKDAVKIFDLIHSIDKISSAEKTDAEAEKIGKIQNILVQVNTSGEETKSGITPEETLDFIEKILSLKNLKLLGLMTIGPFISDENKIRSSFKLLKEIFSDTNKKFGIEMTELSMGMSDDYHLAIKEGATMLRIGSAIFGKRDYSA